MNLPTLLIFQGEGVAYRGRLLVELNTVLGEEIEKEVVKMKESDLIKVQVKK